MKRVSKAEAALRREAKAAAAAAEAEGKVPPKKVKKRVSTLKKVNEDGTPVKKSLPKQPAAASEAARNPEASPEEPSPPASVANGDRALNGEVAAR